MKNTISMWTAVAVFGAAFGASALACTSSPQATYSPASALVQSAAWGESTFLTANQNLVAQAENDNGRSIVGLWDVAFFDSTGKIVVDRAYEIFHSDGTELMTDTSAPATDNVCVGVYRQTGVGTFKLKHVSFNFDLAGNLLGTATFHTTLTVAVGGNSFQGSTTLDVFDTNGNMVFHASGPVKGTRITAD